MHRIYWFSGTGNTLKLASDFTRELGGAELISIASLQDRLEIHFEAETVGIFFPVYCFGMPRIVSKFLERVVASPSPPYIYGVCDSAGMSCSALRMANEIIERKGMRMSAGFSFVMPGNYIPLYGAPSEAKQKKLFDKADKKLRAAAGAVKARRRLRLESNFFLINIVGRIVAKRAIASLAAADRWFWVDESCNGCGLCERICPVNDISLESGKPVWKGNCEQCMACLQWCPKEAIQFRKSSKRRKRYRNPEVSAKDLLR